MKSLISATTVKHYFQYRCERQLRYRMLGRRASELIPKPAGEEGSAWADHGVDFEEQVVEHLASGTKVLLPRPGEKLDLKTTIDFLAGRQPHAYAHQLRLKVPDSAEFCRHYRLDDVFSFSEGFADLVESVTEEGRITAFKLIDIKAVQQATLFHKTQVAYYSLILEAMLRVHGIDVPLHPAGQIWHARPGAGSVEWQITEFNLNAYRAQVIDFLQGTAARVANVSVGPDRDETEFHVYFKCEQCDYLPHCAKSIGDDLRPGDRDLSAVPGMSQRTKAVLKSIGVHTVEQLAHADDVGLHPKVNWALKSSGEVLVARARAILDGVLSRLPERYTHLMPSTFNLGVYLLVDQDPIEGRLAALGCLIERNGRRQFCLETVTENGEAAERAALLKVLSAVVGALDEADSHNASHSRAPVIAHIFLYEPSEAADLRDALGRHLADSTVRTGLLNMLRMFPPDEFPPEPEYRGIQHLPATAQRSVIDALFALPVKVSHDLHSVTSALAKALMPLEEPYEPTDRFRRPFSSRLNIDACRALKEGNLPAAEVETDMRARLTAMASLSRWLVLQNETPGGGFLRLKKQPFRWQESFDPLGAADLDLLLAHEVLHSRTSELAALVSLAMPYEQRRERLKCFAKLRLLSRGDSPSQWAELRLRFAVPPESNRVEIEPGTVGLILTDDNPDLRLDPIAWQQLFVNLVRVEQGPGGLQLVVDVEQGGPFWEKLLAETPQDGWFLDQAHRDFTGPNMHGFLEYLAAGGGEP